MTDPDPQPPAGSDGESLSPREQLARLLQQGAEVLGTAPTESEAELTGLAKASLQRLLELTRTMNRMQDRSELLQYIRARLAELFEAENSVVILCRDGGRYEMLGVEGDNAQHVSEGLFDRVRASRRPVLVHDISTDPELKARSSVRRMNFLSVLCAPLFVEEDLIGFLQFEHSWRPGPFTDDDLALLELFSIQAATALNNVLLLEARDTALRQLEEAQQSRVADSTLRALGQMAAGVAHDFNNLLMSILGVTEIQLRKQSLSESLRTDLEGIRGAVMDGAKTVRRLQEFAGGAADEVTLEPVPVRPLLEAVVHQVRSRLEASPRPGVVGLELDCAEEISALAQRAELRDVLMNLTLNAVEAMPHGGRIRLRARSLKGEIVIEIEDEGEGVDPSVGNRIFEPFFTTKPSGHGLGLSICWGMVRRWGGRMEVAASSFGGALFRVCLRAASSSPQESPPSDTSSSGGAGSARVLLVDDDERVRAVLLRMLEDEGVQTHAVGSGEEAVAILGGDQPFDVLVTDFGMPFMDGGELAQRCASLRPELPVLVVTGWHPGGVQDPIKQPNVEEVLRKPLDASTLVDAIQRVLQAKRG